MSGFKFPKRERICAKSDIDLLFAEANFIRKGPLSIRYILRKREDSPLAMVLMVVPKKRVRLATNRNRIKRQLRELYRLNRVDWDSIGLPQDQSILMAVQYGGEAGISFAALEKYYLKLLEAIVESNRKEWVNKN